MEIWVEIFGQHRGKKYSTGVATRRMAITIKYGNTSRRSARVYVTPQTQIYKHTDKDDARLQNELKVRLMGSES